MAVWYLLVRYPEIATFDPQRYVIKDCTIKLSIWLNGVLFLELFLFHYGKQPAKALRVGRLNNLLKGVVE
jgi:hypothetical protein